MKRQIIASILALSILLPVGTVNAKEGNPKVKSMPIEVLYNARQVKMDVKAKMVNDSVLVPIRFVSDKLGGKITLNGKNIQIVKGNTVLEFVIGSSLAKVNGKPIRLPVSIIEESGRTLVPLRVISEGLGAPVEWDGANQFVWIGNKNIPKLEDIAKEKLVDSKPFLPYFKGREFYLNKNKNKVVVLDKNDLPLQVNGNNLYRLDLAYLDENEYIRASTSAKSVMDTTFFLLINNTSDVSLRIRNSLYREPKGDLRINYYPIVSGYDLSNYGIKNYKSLNLSEIGYIGLVAGYPSAVLIKNTGE
ncbi:copper amine oxidase N-terminal domain-containing protein [Paenibacillus sp. sptzw28]|uniref:stalk domain-containing protein n=1 Tax=Paenibacillus sp. sptzw28 TaxID=715179 RepID=UPI001C6F096F|nr:stalk domain-containing protein [Paenibacillus sp. sptzw28]QYR22998.1 copper amine oxidase N-terminal domain-containing protein [Paenibacillus sp. sptzw28]